MRDLAVGVTDVVRERTRKTKKIVSKPSSKARPCCRGDGKIRRDFDAVVTDRVIETTMKT